MTTVLKNLMSFLIVVAITACSQKEANPPELTTTETSQETIQNPAPQELIDTQSIEAVFWEGLEMNCGQAFQGQSEFPDNPEDSFYGKTLIADFQTCAESEIRVAFIVGEDKSRTWIFTKVANGKIQLKHQHLHADGSTDEISNYGGISSNGEMDFDSKIVHLHFPADEFTQNLIPEASTNVWTIELTRDQQSNKFSLSYNLFRHNKKRFIAQLHQTE